MTEAPIVQIVAQDLERALEALSRHPADDPAVSTIWDELRRALYACWARLPYLVLGVEGDGLYWDAERIISVDEARGLVETLHDGGISSLTIVPGAELDEVRRFLTVLRSAQTLTPDDEDDLSTLLWKQEFDRIHYTTAESEPGVVEPARPSVLKPGVLEPGVPQPTGPQPERIREQVREDAAAPDPRPGVVQLEKFDSTLYFLDQPEIEYLRTAVARDYEQDIGENALALLFDTLEREADPEVREEVVDVLREMYPYLLGRGSFAAAARLLSECDNVIELAPDLTPPQRRALANLSASVSTPEALAQLFFTLEDADVEPSVEALAALLGELKAEAFSTLLLWLKRLARPEARTVLRATLQRLVEMDPSILEDALRSSDRSVVRRALALARRVGATSAIDTVAKLESHDDRELRVLAVETLASLGSGKAFRKLIRFLEDREPDVRIAVLEALAGRPFAGALASVKRMVSASDLEERELGEKRSLFKAFGALAGHGAVTALAPLLDGGGGLWRKGASSDTRACAAVALGRIGSPSARAALERALRDRDPVVRNAVTKALRGEG